MLHPQLIRQFRCSGCGECCRWSGAVLLLDADLRRLAAHLGLSEQEFIDRHTRLAPNRRQLALLDQDNGSCAFLKGDRCTIYAARPEQCRSFPYAWHVAKGCPELDRLTTDQNSVEQESETA